MKTAERRIGRLLQSNSRAAAFYDIQTAYDKQSGHITLSVTKKDDASHWSRMTEGYYLLRSIIPDWDAEDLWRAYIHLTDAESAVKIHKSDLHLRPVWHRKDDRIRAHVFVCFLVFVLWKTFEPMVKRAGLGDEPRRVFEDSKTICMVDVVLTTNEGKQLKTRTVPKSEKPLQILRHRRELNLPERMTKHIL